MSDWEEESDVYVQVAIPKKNNWDDEDVEEQVKEDWEESDKEENVENKNTTPIKKKVTIKQKIAEKVAAEEQKKKELEAKKAAGESDKEEEESAFKRRERARQLELEADMENATDLFSGVSLDNQSIEDLKGKPLEEWNPTNRAQMDAFRKRLVEIITPASKFNNFSWFMDELLRDLAVPLEEKDVKKISISLTKIANDKQQAAKDATKKTKGKAKPTLAAAGKNSTADTGDNDYDDYDDFM